MMHQRIIDPATVWLILRTSGAQTLRLASSLQEAGFEAWTPKRTYKRPKPGKCARIDGRKPTIEIDAPILPTFVFARADRETELVAAIADTASRLPAFSIFCHAGRRPFVSDHAIAGLRNEEQREADLLEQLRQAEDRDEKRRIRAAAQRTERLRRKALRSERKEFEIGAAVNVAEMPSFDGMTGIVTSSDGRSALVSFGGNFVVKIDAWQLEPIGVSASHLAA